MNGRPLAARLELDDGFDHRKRCGIGRRFGTPNLSEHRLDLGKRREQRILTRELTFRLFDRNVRQGRRHVEHVSLVQRRHELVSEPQERGDRRQEGEGTDEDRRDRAPQSHVDERPVHRDDGSRHRMVGFALDSAAQEKVAQRGRQRDAEHRGGDHDEGLGVRERLEEPATLTVQSEDRNERNGDDEQREEDGGRDLHSSFVKEPFTVLLRDVGRRVFELLVASLDHHDLGIDGGADSNRDAAEAHDGRGDIEDVHRDEREEDRDWQD